MKKACCKIFTRES